MSPPDPSPSSEHSEKSSEPSDSDAASPSPDEGLGSNAKAELAEASEAFVEREVDDFSATKKEELYSRFLEVQEKELDIQVQQVANDREANQLNAEFATESLKVQASDRADQRRADAEKQKRILIFGGAALIVLVCICWLFLHYGMTDLLEEIIKMFMSFTVGVIGGASFVWRKLAKAISEDEDN